MDVWYIQISLSKRFLSAGSHNTGGRITFVI